MNNTENILQHCTAGCDCAVAEKDLEKIMLDYAKLGAIPHCFFPELCEKQMILASDCDFNAAAITFFTSPEAFYQNNPAEATHMHISLAQIKASCPDVKAQLKISSGSDAVIELSSQDSVKLFEQAEYALKRVYEQLEEIEIEEGQQLIFSTPDPELPQAFIDYLAAVFSELAEVAAVYAFETTVPGEDSNLVIAIEPSKGVAACGLERLSMLIVEGADQFLEERNQIDFMVIQPEDSELLEVIASVSPEIKRVS